MCRVVHDEGARAGVRVEERRENSTWLARTGELNLAYVAGFWQGLHVRSCGGQRVWRVVAWGRTETTHGSDKLDSNSR
eukprot:COSAG06_NODE_99_length_24156_cov_20.889549_28_plen_78_part_00